MPKKIEGDVYQKKYTEEDVQNALLEIENGLSKKAASRKYNVPRATIQFRMSQKFSKTSFGPAPILSNVEETLLVTWIRESLRKGFPQRKEDLQASVHHFLEANPRQNPFKDNHPGEGWYKGFLRRHQELTERQPEAVTLASANVSEADIRSWFQQIETYLKEEDLFQILDDSIRVFNSDETNFQLCPKTKKVIAPRGTRNVYEVDRGQAKFTLTVLFTFAASDTITAPMIIYPYKPYKPSEISMSVPKSWGIGISSNGWMKSELFYEYIANIFYKDLFERNTKFPVILFVDGHSTHLTYKVSELCKQLKIILIALYPNTTRILQPADVSAFKPMKSFWKKGVLDWRRDNPSGALTKEHVASILQRVLKHIKPEIICHGFRASGILML
ncbi:hypothetical protein MTP99_012943 [Tenebrio molitor]|jgi:hypothetical protein|nr:hypothetical protein MTP99_012943 [Tenebrio molitor]